MSIGSFEVYDYSVFVLMLLISTAIGVYYAWKDRKRQCNKEFLMGGKRMGIIPVSMSLMASYMTPIAILGYPAEIYLKGTQFWLSVVDIVVATIIAAEIFVPIFYRINLTSVNEYLYKRFNSHGVRAVASISFLIFYLPYLGVVLYGPSLALAAVTKLPVLWSVVLMGIICTFYTTIGGLKAVIWTDVVQFILMFLGMFVVVVKGTLDAGGISELFRKSSLGNRLQFFNTEFDIHSSTNIWTVVIGMTTIWIGFFSTNQMQVQRSCSMSNIKKAKISLYISMPGIMLLLSLSCYSGLVVLANNYDCDPLLTKQVERADQLLPYFVLQSFAGYPGIPGLFVACVFSSSLSTLSSGYNAMAAILWEDFIKTRLKNVSEKRDVWITRIIAALIGLISIGAGLLISQVGTIFEATIAIMGAQMGPIFALFVIGVFFPFANYIGAISGLLSGQISCLFITIGAIINKRPQSYLPTTTEGCDIGLYGNNTSLGIPLDILSTATIPTYFPEGLNTVFHISPYIVPFVGFIISLTVGIVVSLLTLGINGNWVHSQYLNGKANQLYLYIIKENKKNIEFPLK